MIVPSPLRGILSDSTRISSGRISRISWAPRVSISGTTSELSRFFQDAADRIGINVVVPTIMSALLDSYRRFVYVMTGCACDDCGLGRGYGQARDCEHPDLIIDRALIVDGMFVLRPDVVPVEVRAFRDHRCNRISSLMAISRTRSRSREIIDDVLLASKDEVMHRWRSDPILPPAGRVDLISIPPFISSDGAFWDRILFLSIRKWIEDVLRDVAMFRGMISRGVGTLTGEFPAPIPLIGWCH